MTQRTGVSCFVNPMHPHADNPFPGRLLQARQMRGLSLRERIAAAAMQAAWIESADSHRGTQI